MEMNRQQIMLVGALFVAQIVRAQAPTADTLICTDGEKLVGHLISATSSSVVFKSDAAGQVTVDWSKIQELHSSSAFAVLPKGLKLRGAHDASKVPQGTLSVADGKAAVAPANAATPQTVSVTDVAQVVSESSFQNALHARNLLQGWNGGASAGLSYTDSTQESQTYTVAVNLARAVPGESWMDQRSRTLLTFNDAYGKITQPGTPSTKTSTLHLGLEQDWYLRPRLFAFGQALLDHDYSQGLDLQQDYGGGLGLVVVKTAVQEFDAKASLDYIDQQFTFSSENKNLVASTFGETYLLKFKHRIVFNESGNYSPAWNDSHAYSSVANASLTFPVYRRLGFTVGAIDSFLNDPPPGFKKNSFILTLGASYSIH